MTAAGRSRRIVHVKTPHPRRADPLACVLLATNRRTRTAPATRRRPDAACDL